MTWKDKPELGLKEEPASGRDNLPPSQIRGPELPTGPGRSPEIPLVSPEIPLVRGDRTQVAIEPRGRTTSARSRRTGRVWARSSKARRNRQALT